MKIPDDEKVLDGNGRLIDLANASDKQKANMTRIVGGIASPQSTNRQREKEAAITMANTMSRTYLDFEQNIVVNLKRQ